MIKLESLNGFDQMTKQEMKGIVGRGTYVVPSKDENGRHIDNKTYDCWTDKNGNIVRKLISIELLVKIETDTIIDSVGQIDTIYVKP
ncbi:hypothetical protein HW49_06505 [Porphyromonadaceae bacterium COT-184 OH4590]|nr:hypothetical protein HW49_06505 [Porphyromonadaceae bacterium COT-184 OH4590]